jgi:hypothetical protein
MAADATTPIASSASGGWDPTFVLKVGGGLAVVTVIVLVLATALLWRAKAEADQVVKVLGVLLVIGLSAGLLVVGYSHEQVTPIIGLFGAIVGYLLGKDTHKS